MIYNAIHGPARFLSKLNLPPAPQCRFIYEHGSSIEQREAGVIFPPVPCWYRDGTGRYHQRRGGLFYTESLEEWLSQLEDAIVKMDDQWSKDDICILNIESPGVRAESRPATMRAILAERCLHYGLDQCAADVDQIDPIWGEGIRLYNEAAPKWYEGMARTCREWFSGVGYYNVLPNPGTTVDRVIAASDFVAVDVYGATYEQAAGKIEDAKKGGHSKPIYAMIFPRELAVGSNIVDMCNEIRISGATPMLWDSVFDAKHVKAYTPALLKQVRKVLEASP